MVNDNSSGTPAIFSIEEWAQTSRRAIVLGPAGTSQIPRFLVPKEPAGSGLWDSVRAVCARGGPQPAAFLPFRKSFLSQRGPSSSFFGASILLHCLAIAGLIYIPPVHARKTRDAHFRGSLRHEDLLHDTRTREASSKGAAFHCSSSQASQPGEGAKPEEIPHLGSAVSLGDLTVISKPLQPDNHHQTIIQPLSPPEMRITQDVKLPNVILGNLSAPRAPLTFAATAMPKPEQTNHQAAAVAAPNLTDPLHGDAVPLLAANEPVIAKPLLPIALRKPNQPERRGSAPASQGAAPAPVLAADQAHGDAVAQLAGSNEPSIAKPLPPVALQKPIQQGRGGNGQASQIADGPPSLSDSNGLMIVSVDPSGTASQIAVPPGNRWGDFAIAPGRETARRGALPIAVARTLGPQDKMARAAIRALELERVEREAAEDPKARRLAPSASKARCPPRTSLCCWFQVLPLKWFIRCPFPWSRRAPPESHGCLRRLDRRRRT